MNGKVFVLFLVLFRYLNVYTGLCEEVELDRLESVLGLSLMQVMCWDNFLVRLCVYGFGYGFDVVWDMAFSRLKA